MFKPYTVPATIIATLCKDYQHWLEKNPHFGEVALISPENVQA